LLYFELCANSSVCMVSLKPLYKELFMSPLHLQAFTWRVSHLSFGCLSILTSMRRFFPACTWAAEAARK
jgi:hypothetical protein